MSNLRKNIQSGQSSNKIMKMKHFISYLLFISLLFSTLSGCASVKKELIRTGDNDQAIAIHNAIVDFSHSCRLYKKDSVFSVSYHAKVYDEAYLTKRYDPMFGNEIMTWMPGPLREDLVLVTISAAPEAHFLVTANTRVGENGHIPSRYVIMDGKLFYWFDDSYPLTKEMLDILWKYNLLQDDDGGLITVPDNPINDSKKGADYYFCKNNLTKYKRIVTNIGHGFYKPPKLKCN